MHCPCSCCSFVIICGLFEWKRICARCFSSFVYICIAFGDPAIKRGVGIPLIGLGPPHLSACPKPGSGSLTSYVVVLCAISELWWTERWLLVILPSLFKLSVCNNHADTDQHLILMIQVNKPVNWYLSATSHWINVAFVCPYCCWSSFAVSLPLLVRISNI
jgi:hypothetical protein